MSTESKPLFRNQFRDYVENILGESFDSQTDVTRSKLMARFFAEQILAPRDPTLLPFGEEELAACMVDGKGDQGVDFIARENNTVLIVQAKYSGVKKPTHRPVENPAEFEHFRGVLRRLSEYRTLEMNQPLRDVCADIDWEKDRFLLYYITLRQLSANQEELAKTPVTNPTHFTDILERTELYLLNEIGLNAELRDTLSIDEDSSEPISLRLSPNVEGKTWLKLFDDESGRACFVGKISGSQLAGLFARYRSRLFTLNIRNYLGDNITNKSIRKTALETPEDFFFFNNGISALATRIEADPSDSEGHTLKCHNFSVINGAQTIRSLHKAHSKNPDQVRDVNVLLRLTEYKAKKTRTEQEFIDNVTKYNNTQTSIRISDFRSNDKVQYDIRNRFSQLRAVDGKKFVYRNKRSGEREVGARTIGMEEFVKTLYSFIYGPDDVFGGTSHIFDATKDGGYTKLFGDNGEILPTLDNSEFERYAGIWFMCSYAKEIWRDRSAKTKDDALERRWMFYFALGVALENSYAGDEETLTAHLRRLGDPDWTRKDSGVDTKRAISTLSRIAFKGMQDAYNEASAKDGFTHRNWFRTLATLDMIRKHIANSWELVSEHANDYRLVKKAGGTDLNRL